MVEAGTMCVRNDVVLKAGAGASATGIVEASTNIFIQNAEAYICGAVQYDFVTNWASLNAIMKRTLTDLCSSLAAMDAIAYDMSGYSSLAQAQTILNVLWGKSTNMIRLIKEQDFKTFTTSG